MGLAFFADRDHDFGVPIENLYGVGLNMKSVHDKGFKYTSILFCQNFAIAIIMQGKFSWECYRTQKVNKKYFKPMT